MAKIGTAHVEIKPVLNEAALIAIAQQIEDTVAAAVARGMATGTPRHTFTNHKDHTCPICYPGATASKAESN